MAEDEKRQYEPDDLLSVSDVAELIDRTGSLVRKLINDLEIPHQRFGKNNQIVVKFKDLQPIFDRNMIRGYTPPEDEE